MSKMTDIVGHNFIKNVDKVIEETQRDKTAKQVAMEYKFFCENLLPVFSGKVEDPDFNEKYISFVGGTDVRLNVVEGTTLRLSIPPVLDTVKLKIGSKDKVSVHGAFEDYAKTSVVNSSVAVSNLAADIATVYEGIDVDHYYTNILQWNEVLLENGYEPYDVSGLELIAKDLRGVQTKVTGDKEDLPEFDDGFGDW